MRMKDPIPTFTYLVSKIAEKYPDFAYLHLVEPGITGASDSEAKEGDVSNLSLQVSVMGTHQFAP